MSEAKKSASAKGAKPMDKDKEEVLENIMEELEQEAKDKEKAAEEAPVEETAAEEPSETSEATEGAEEDKKKGLFNKKEKKHKCFIEHKERWGPFNDNLNGKENK